jgi:hypothetical protein
MNSSAESRKNHQTTITQSQRTPKLARTTQTKTLSNQDMMEIQDSINSSRQ